MSTFDNTGQTATEGISREEGLAKLGGDQFTTNGTAVVARIEESLDTVFALHDANYPNGMIGTVMDQLTQQLKGLDPSVESEKTLGPAIPDAGGQFALAAAPTTEQPESQPVPGFDLSGSKLT